MRSKYSLKKTLSLSIGRKESFEIKLVGQQTDQSLRRQAAARNSLKSTPTYIFPNFFSYLYFSDFFKSVLRVPVAALDLGDLDIPQPGEGGRPRRGVEGELDGGGVAAVGANVDVH